MLAHIGIGTTDVLSGLVHPVTGFDHLLAMVMVGALGVVLQRRLRLPLCFLGAMVAGGALAMSGVQLPFVEQFVAASVILLGVALAAGATSRPGLTALLVLAAGFVHGHAHGLEAPGATHPLVYIAGFVVATAALHAIGVLGASSVGRSRVIRPAVGGLSALVGAGLLVTAF